MTVRQFTGMFDEIGRVLKLESGSNETPAMLEGKAAYSYMMKRFGKKK